MTYAQRWLAAGSAVALTMTAAPLPANQVCNPVGSTEMVASFVPPKGASIVGLKLEIQYPNGVDLPGLADEASVKERVRMLPGGVLFSPNDTDGTLVVALVGTTPLAAGPLLNLRFDRCAGTPAPRPEDFHCRVEQGSDAAGTLVTNGLTCAVAMAAAPKGEGK